MSRFGPVKCYFYAPGALSTILVDGSGVNFRTPIDGDGTQIASAEGDAVLTFVNDVGLATLAAPGNVCWARYPDALRVADFPAPGQTFIEPFFIRKRQVGPDDHTLTISGESLVSELKDYTIYRPLGDEVITATTIKTGFPASGPITDRVSLVGTPAGNNSIELDDTEDSDVGMEIRILMDGGAGWHVSVVEQVRLWEGGKHLAFRDRLPYPSSAGNDVELWTRIIQVTNAAPFQVGVEAHVLLDDASTHITLIDEAPGGDSGTSITLRDAIPSAAAAGNAVTAKDYSAPSTDDVTQVMAFAPGWSVEFQTGTGTEFGTRYGGGGDTVYDILTAIAQESGEYFRIKTADAPTAGPKRTIVWRRTHDNAGVSGLLRLVMPSQASMASDTANVNRGILIEKPRHEGEYDPVTQVIPVAGDPRITLFSISSAGSTAAAGKGYEIVSTGLGLYAPPYVRNPTLEASIGVHQRRVVFSEVTIEGDNVASLRAAADMLLNLAIAYLREHRSVERTIEVAFVTAINVLPGNTIEMDYTAPTGEYSISYTGGTPLYVQSVSREVSGTGEYPGVPITRCVLTTNTHRGRDNYSTAIGKRLMSIDRLAARLNTPQLTRIAVNAGTGGSTPPTGHPHITTDNSITHPDTILKTGVTGSLTLARLIVGERDGAVEPKDEPYPFTVRAGATFRDEIDALGGVTLTSPDDNSKAVLQRLRIDGRICLVGRSWAALYGDDA